MPQIMIPLDIDSDKTSADRLGEALRNLLFDPTKEGIGGYHHFDLNPDYAFATLSTDQAWSVLDYEDEEQSEQSIIPDGWTVYLRPVYVDMVLLWDGDGHLVFRITDEEGNVLRIIENTDCKKTYRWEDRK